MVESDLPSPRIGGRGHHLRRIAALSISQLQISAVNYPGGVHPSGTDLRAFFEACADACQAFDATPADPRDRSS